VLFLYRDNSQHNPQNDHLFKTISKIKSVSNQIYNQINDAKQNRIRAINLKIALVLIAFPFSKKGQNEHKLTKNE